MPRSSRPAGATTARDGSRQGAPRPLWAALNEAVAAVAAAVGAAVVAVVAAAAVVVVVAVVVAAVAVLRTATVLLGARWPKGRRLVLEGIRDAGGGVGAAVMRDVTMHMYA